MRARAIALCLLPPAAAFAVGWVTAPDANPQASTPAAAASSKSTPSSPLTREDILKLDYAHQREHLQKLPTDELLSFVRSLNNASRAELQLAHRAGEELGRRLGSEAVAVLGDLPTGKTIDAVILSAVYGWAETEPIAAATWAMANRPRDANQLIYNFASEHPHRVTELVTIPGVTPQIAKSALGNAGAAMLRDSHDKALVWLESLTPEHREFATPNFLSALAPLDPKRAGELLITLPIERWHNHAAPIAVEWTKTDPAAALEWLDSLPPNDAAWKARVAALSTWASFDTAAAWQYFSSLDAKELSDVLDEKVDYQPRSGSSSRFRGFGAPRLAETLFKSADGASKAELREWMLASGSKNFEKVVLVDELNQLAKVDPGAAIARVGELSKIGGSDAPALVLDPLIDEMASSDPKAALELASTFPGHHRHNGINSTFQEWAKRDPVSVLAHIEEMSPGNARNSAIQAYVISQESRDPEAAARAYADHLIASPNYNPGTSKDYRASGIVQSWFGPDPSAAGEWAANLESPTARQSALTQLLKLWQAYDPGTAKGRLEDLGVSAEEIRSL